MFLFHVLVIVFYLLCLLLLVSVHYNVEVVIRVWLELYGRGFSRIRGWLGDVLLCRMIMIYGFGLCDG